ncbi:MAG: peptidase [Alphaproteobacteria bacterium]
MTYCVGLLLNEGLVMLSDSRTNAGVDYISTYSKLTVWETPGERAVALSTAGNLSISQNVVTMLDEGLPDASGKLVSMRTVESMTEAARLVGRAIREVERLEGPNMRQAGVGFDVSFILGGQINGRQLRMFLFYTAGNYIEASTESPFFQIGELKYGKPILDRIVNFETSLEDATKCALISMDSTIRSNISVGLPLDLLVFRRNAADIETLRVIPVDDPYFKTVSEGWSSGLREAFEKIPAPQWGESSGPVVTLVS